MSPSQRSPATPPSVLYVEDESDLRRTVSTYLEKRLEGISIRAVGSGEEALDLLDRERFDLVITDLRMPGIDGLSLVTEAQKRRFRGQIIVLSAHTGPDIENELRQLGVLATLTKPFAVSQLAQLITEIIGTGQPGAHRLTPTGVAQLFEVEQKSGMLRVRHGSRQGDLYFQKGRLVNALTDSKSAREAALEILAWDQASVEIHSIALSMPEQIVEPLQFLILEAARLHDEDGRDSPGARAHVSETGEVTQTLETPKENRTMANVAESLKELTGIEGFIGAALVDYESGMVLGHLGGGGEIDLEVAGAGNTEVVRAKMKVMEATNLNDEIEDILISLGKHYHLIRLLKAQKGLFLYLAIDRARSNLALARHKLSTVEKELTI